MNALQQGIERGDITVAAGRPERVPVESWETREDAADS
jgi:hypothetical protein